MRLARASLIWDHSPLPTLTLPHNTTERTKAATWINPSTKNSTNGSTSHLKPIFQATLISLENIKC